LFFTAGIGIDISDREVNIVCLRGAVGGFKLVAAEKCLLAEDKPLKAKTEDISEFINEFIKSRRISAAEIIIGIPSDKVLFREIEFPMAVKENLGATLSYEMEKYLPVSMDEVYYDYQLVREDGERQVLSVVLVAVKREELAPVLEVASDLRIKPSGLTTRTAGIANSFLSDNGGASGLHLIALPDKDGLQISVVKNKAMVYAKKILPDEKALPEAAYTEKLRELSLRFSDSAEPVGVCLHGLSAETAGIEISDKEESFSFSGIKAPSADLPETGYIPAYGMAAHALKAAPVELNLMPERLRKKPNKLPYYLMYGLAGLLVCAGLLYGTVHLYRQHAYLDRLDKQLADVRRQAQAVEQIHADIRNLKTRIDHLKSLRPGNAYVVNVLLELTQRIPASAWVKNARISGNEVRIMGDAESASDLIPLLEESPLFYEAEFYSTIRKTRENKELFHISLKFSQAGS
jgi:general secretion pathway protein L